MPYLSASVVVIHYKEALYQVYAPLPFTFTRDSDTTFEVKRSNVNLQGAGAYCGGLLHSLFVFF